MDFGNGITMEWMDERAGTEAINRALEFRSTIEDIEDEFELEFPETVYMFAFQHMKRMEKHEQCWMDLLNAMELLGSDLSGPKAEALKRATTRRSTMEDLVGPLGLCEKEAVQVLGYQKSRSV